MPTATTTVATAIPAHTAQNPRYSVEFFHIYTDEQIGTTQLKSLEYLRAVKDVWDIDASFIVFIDNYNPTEHVLTPKEVLDFLKGEGVQPDYWAFEGELIANAKKFLASITNRRLQKSYERYIEQHGKFPCSLLTASWYMTRLGVFDASMIKQNSLAGAYRPADRLINILPAAYKPVEARAFELIMSSPYAHYADNIQDLFYDAEANRALDLF